MLREIEADLFKYEKQLKVEKKLDAGQIRDKV